MRGLIVDDEPLARRGIVLRLRKFRDVEIVGECGDGTALTASPRQLCRTHNQYAGHFSCLVLTFWVPKSPP